MGDRQVDPSLAVGVDLGGTNVALALVGPDHRVVERTRVKTPRGGPDKVVDAIVGGVRRLEGAPACVGVGAPGPVDDGVVVTAVNLAGWAEPVPLAVLLQERLGLPVTVDNDANVGAVGEWVAGAGRGARFLLGVWLGTGVGGGLVLAGEPYRGAFGGAGEFGHMCVRDGGALCSCGQRGCVEAYAGRASMERVVENAVAHGRDTALEAIRRDRGRKRYTSGIWARALAAGDELANEVLDEAVEALGAGLGAAVNLLDLDRIVVGGGLAEKLGQELADRIGAAMRRHLLVRGQARHVVVAELGDDAGAIGAAALARAALGVPLGPAQPRQLSAQ